MYAGSGLRYLTNSAPDGSYALSVYQNGRLMSLTQYDGSTAHNQIGQTAYAYDPHGRQSTVTDARNGATSYTFNNADQVATGHQSAAWFRPGRPDHHHLFRHLPPGLELSPQP